MLNIKTLLEDAVKNVKEIEIRKKKVLGQLKLHKGHKVFEINLKEATIEEATIEKGVAKPFDKKQTTQGLGMLTHRKTGHKKLAILGQKIIRSKIIEKKDCIYIPALNKKNAIKKLIKLQNAR